MGDWLTVDALPVQQTRAQPLYREPGLVELLEAFRLMAGRPPQGPLLGSAPRSDPGRLDPRHALLPRHAALRSPGLPRRPGYIDIRTPDRLEDFYAKVQQDEGVTFIKSKIADLSEQADSGEIVLNGEDTLAGRIKRLFQGWASNARV